MPSVEGAKKKGLKKTQPIDDIPEPIEQQDDLDRTIEGEADIIPVQRKTKWQKFKKALSRKMSTKRKKKATSVVEVRIVQEDEDDTDYDKQWSRKVEHSGAKWFNRGDETGSRGSSSRGSSPRKAGEDLPEDGIMVIHDAEDDEDEGEQ